MSYALSIMSLIPFENTVGILRASAPDDYAFSDWSRIFQSVRPNMERVEVRLQKERAFKNSILEL